MKKILTGVFLGGCFLALSVFGQPGKQKPVGPSDLDHLLVKEFKAFCIQYLVEGDVKGGEAAIRQALTRAGAKDKHRIRARLVFFLERLGRDEVARKELVPLLSAPEPYAGWAKRRMGDGLSLPQGQAKDPLEQVIRKLDEGNITVQKVKDGYRSLLDLGPLAVPTLLKFLPKMGPFGKRNILQVMRDMKGGRDGLVEAMDQLLTSDDPGDWLATVDYFDSLTQTRLRRLVVKGLALSQLQVRLAILGALGEFPGERALVLSELRKMVVKADEDVLGKILDVIEWGDLARDPGFAGLFKLIEERASGDVVYRIPFYWLDYLAGPGDEDEALVRLEKLVGDQGERHQMFIDQVIKREKLPWTRLIRKGLSHPFLVKKVLDACEKMKVAISPQEIHQLLVSPDVRVRSEIVYWLFDKRFPVAGERMMPLLQDKSRSIRVKAFKYLEVMHPQMLRAKAHTLLKDTLLQSMTSLFITEKRNRNELAVKEAIRLLRANPRKIPNGIMSLFRNSSGPANLEDLVALVDITDKRNLSNILTHRQQLEVGEGINLGLERAGIPQALAGLNNVPEGVGVNILAKAMSIATSHDAGLFIALLQDCSGVQETKNGDDSGNGVAEKKLPSWWKPLTKGTKRGYAIRALGKIGGPEALPILAKCLFAKNGGYSGALAACASIIKRHPQGDVLGTLAKLVAHSGRQHDVKNLAQTIFSQRRDQESLDCLHRLLQSPEDTAQEIALNAIFVHPKADQKALAKEIMTAKTLAPVANLLILSNHGGILAEDPELRKLTILWLIKHSTLYRSNAYTSRWTNKFFSALSEVDRRQMAREILAKWRAQKGMNSKLLKEAIGFIGDAKDVSLIPVLGRFINHPSGPVKSAAIRNLGRIFSVEVVPYLLAAMRDDDHTVRAKAQKALADLRVYLDEKKKWDDRLGPEKK